RPKRDLQRDLAVLEDAKLLDHVEVAERAVELGVADLVNGLLGLLARQHRIPSVRGARRGAQIGMMSKAPLPPLMEGRPRALARIPLGLRVPYPCRASRWGKLNADRTAGNCTIVDLGDGTSAIKCPDGSELVVQNGKDGKDGKDGADGNGV